MTSPAVSRSGDSAASHAALTQLRFGAAFYTEYSPYDRLDQDLDLMASARFSVIRVGESVWATWEPDEGRFELDWLEPVLDGADHRGIDVILGTPTYAIPPWMARKYPEVVTERASGERIAFGHRQNADFSHPAFRYLAERVVQRILTRYAGHPAVVGYQVDNEPGIELIHNHSVFERFVDSLRDAYGDVETLNDRWGLTYWSHRLSRWSDLWVPDGNTTPAYDLAWRRFQARLTSEFIHWQARIVRQHARESQFITTCLSFRRPSLDPVDLASELDVTAVNLYYPMQEGLALDPPQWDLELIRPRFVEGAGPWWLYLQSDIARGVRQEPFLVAETNASFIGEPHSNFGAFDGQWRQAAWAMVSRGARMIEYWHWHTNHFGHETYWGGVLGHSLEPGRCYDELARTGAELAVAEELLESMESEEQVGFLVSPASRWAFEFQPPLAVEGTNEPDPSSYNRIVAALYRGFFEAGAQAAIVQPQQLESDARALVDRWPVLVVPALYVAGDELLELLVAYAGAGGHLVLTFRTGYADEDARPRPDVMPGVLSEAVGATYLEFMNLVTPVKLVSSGGGLDVGGGRAMAWADGLSVSTAHPLAQYEHPHLGRWPAIITNEHESGRVTYLGTLPDATLAHSLAQWVVRTSLGEDPWRCLAASVTATSARVAAGTVRFVHNWSWEPVSIILPRTVRNVLTGERIDPGGQLWLDAWDVFILIEDREAS